MWSPATSVAWTLPEKRFPIIRPSARRRKNIWKEVPSKHHPSGDMFDESETLIKEKMDRIISDRPLWVTDSRSSWKGPARTNVDQMEWKGRLMQWWVSARPSKVGKGRRERVECLHCLLGGGRQYQWSHPLKTSPRPALSTSPLLSLWGPAPHPQ